MITRYTRAEMPALNRFGRDSAGAVASEFVMLSAALIMGVGVTMTTLTTSLNVGVGVLASEISYSGCPFKRSLNGSDELQKLSC